MTVHMNAEQKQQLDEEGYVVLPGLMEPEFLRAAQRRVDELYEQEGEAAGSEFKLEPQSKRLANVVNKGEIFLRVINTPAVLECMAHVLGPRFKLSSLNVRSADPHSDWVQPLHIDGGGLPDEKGYYVCNSIWILDDFTDRQRRHTTDSRQPSVEPEAGRCPLRSDGSSPAGDFDNRERWNRRGDELSPLAWWHGQSHRQGTPGDPCLLHSQRQTATALSEEVSRPGVAGELVTAIAQPASSGRSGKR